MKLKELTKEYKYKIDFHTHTRPASPCSEMTPKMLVERYVKLGFDGIVLTNHFIDFLLKSDNPKKAADIYLKDYYKTKKEGEKHGLKVYLGMEVRFPENYNDYLVYGINENDVEEIFKYIHTDFKTFYKGFKNDKNVILQAHPFRDRMVLQDPEYLDGIEVFNMHPNHNSKIGFAARYANQFSDFIKTCGSDFHHDTHQGVGATLLKEMPEDSVAIGSILKSGDYLFEISGNIIIP